MRATLIKTTPIYSNQIKSKMLNQSQTYVNQTKHSQSINKHVQRNPNTSILNVRCCSQKLNQNMLQTPSNSSNINFTNSNPTLTHSLLSKPNQAQPNLPKKGCIRSFKSRIVKVSAPIMI